MTGFIVVFPKPEEAGSIKNILVRNGFTVSAVCTTGAQAIGIADGMNGGIVLCGYRLPDMVCTELRECLPSGFEMLLLASKSLLMEEPVRDVVALAMPLKVHELIHTAGMMAEAAERSRRLRRSRPRERSREDRVLIQDAKCLLMERNHMSEEEAHKYLQKCSMDSSRDLVETAQMVLSIMQG